MPTELHEPVVALMREVGRDIVMPRYRNLASHEVSEKAADDFVTIADKESEIRLAEGLSAILPEAGIIGEEACAADRSEENTSELQSLMRSSYYGFCLTKKNTITTKSIQKK